MPHRLVLVEWLYKADQDFGFASLSIASETVTYFDQICFFFHQSAEKYLKAYIINFHLQFGKQHDLVKLLKTCYKYDPSLDALSESCQFLNPFYIETRYADEIFAVTTREQAEQARVHAEKIQRVIRGKVDIIREVTLAEVREEDEKVNKELTKL